MNMKKTVFLLALWLCIGHSGFSFAADSPAKKPAASKASVKSNTPDMKDHCEEHKKHNEELNGGMTSNQMCSQMCGQMGSHEGGHMGGMMGGQMGSHEGGHMGGMMGGQAGSHEGGGMMGSHEGGHMGGMMGCQAGSHEGGHMGGMMGNHESGAMMKTPRIDRVMALDLSNEQRSKINKLSDELKHNNWAAKGLIMDGSAKLRDLYGADKRDPSAIGKEYQKIFDSERQMIEAVIDTQNRIEELLTPEQRAQMKDMHRKTEPKRCHSKQ